MDQVKKKVFTLLKEIDYCCEQSGIDYYVCGSALLDAHRVGELRDGTHHVSVAILAEDADKFVESMGQREDRSLEYWGNSKNYPDFSIRYIDKESLCYNMLNHRAFNHNGIFVRVDIIRDESRVTHFKRWLERGISLNSGNFKQRASVKALILKYGVKFFLFVRGKEGFLEKYFKKQTFSSEERMQLFRLAGKAYPSLLLEGSKQFVKLHDSKFQTFAYAEEYLMYRFGYGWKRVELKVDNDDMIISPCIKAEDYEKALASYNWNDKKFIRNKVWIKLKHSAWVNRRIRTEQQKTRHIVDMIYLKSIYSPKKKEIVALYKEGNLNGLRDELSIYLDLIEKRKHGLNFDLEIFEIAMDLLRQDRGRLYVEQLRG